VLAEWGLSHLADDAILIVSELMTNALDASMCMPTNPPIALRLIAEAGRLVIEAWDQSPLELAPIDADNDSECGRGFTVIAALSNSWGHRRITRDRKVVWAVLEFE
jgi:anti-sigma regulatory factor (Ser/Thr protein kinase)